MNNDLRPIGIHLVAIFITWIKQDIAPLGAKQLMINIIAIAWHSMPSRRSVCRNIVVPNVIIIDRFSLHEGHIAFFNRNWWHWKALHFFSALIRVNSSRNRFIHRYDLYINMYGGLLFIKHIPYCIGCYAQCQYSIVSVKLTFVVEVWWIQLLLK